MPKQIICQVIVVFFCCLGFSQNILFIQPDSLPRNFNKDWKFNLSDNPVYCKVEFSDPDWKTCDPALQKENLDKTGFNGFAWFRLHLRVDSSLINKLFVLSINHLGASEIYVDGVLIAAYGKVSVNGTDEKRLNPVGKSLPLVFNSTAVHVIAVRYSNHKFRQFWAWDDFNAGFNMDLDRDHNQDFAYQGDLVKLNVIFLGVGGFLLALTFIHVFFFLYYRKQKHHLYYSFFTFFFAMFFFLPYFSYNLRDPDITEPMGYFIPMAVPVYFIALAGFTHYLILEKLPRTFWISVFIGLIIISGFFFKTGYNQYFYAILIFFVIHQSFTALAEGRKMKKDGIKIISWGFLIFVLFVSLFGIDFLMMVTGLSQYSIKITQDTIYFLLPGILSIPVSISLYMARSFASVNISLEKKLEEVEELSAKALEQEKEKQQILSEQNSILEEKVKARTAEVVEQKEILEEKQKEILDSIRYAKRIQTSLMPTEKYIEKIFKKRKPL